MSKNAPISNVALLVLLSVMTCIAWTLLTGQCWFWIPVVAALAVSAWIAGKSR